MTLEQGIQHKFEGNVCCLQIPLRQPHGEPRGVAAAERGRNAQCALNQRNCDIFVEDHNFYIYADVRLYKFQLPQRQFDTKDMKNLVIKYNSKTAVYEVNLPCLPQVADEQKTHPEKGELEKKKSDNTLERSVELWKLKRITDNCQLQQDNAGELQKFIADFGFGFASSFKGQITDVDDLTAISRMPEPHLVSPLQRSIDREIDELKNFSRDQYKLNFVELQVPEGHDNPMKYTTNFEDITLNRDEECLLHNLTRKTVTLPLLSGHDQTEIDCGLVSILLAICYDIRSTSCEPTCESAWARSTLSAMLSYFEPFDNLKEVVISFLRRSLIFPLYRNYDFGRLCVQDTIDALQKNDAWVLKQLLQTHALFASSDCGRELFNRYYIEDYVRYVADGSRCGATHLQLLARNLKNVLLDVCKKHLRLELGEIETELLKELITDIHIGTSASEEEEEDEDTEDEYDASEDDDNDEGDGTESGEDITESSSASDTEQNSVIEQCKEVVNV